jgi:hypothetical protein
MIFRLDNDYNLRAYSFEYIAQIMLRRTRQNNFIFQVVRFDSLDEIISKYRIVFPDSFKDAKEMISKYWGKFDILELVLNNVDSREVTSIVCYEVKTKFMTAYVKSFYACISNDEFMRKISGIPGCVSNVVSIMLFENWKFSFNIYSYSDIKVRLNSKEYPVSKPCLVASKECDFDLQNASNQSNY